MKKTKHRFQILCFTLAALIVFPYFSFGEGGGSGAGGTHRHSPINLEWCSSTVEKLKIAQTSARISLQKNEHQVAFQKLQEGIIQSLSTLKKENKSYIEHIILELGLEISTKMRIFLNHENDREFIVKKMFQLYNQLLIPFLQIGENKWNVSILNNEILKFASVFYSYNKESDRYIPQANPILALQIIYEISQKVYINQTKYNLHKSMHQCQNQALKHLINEIQKFLMNIHPDYTQEDIYREAFNSFITQFEEIKKEYQQKCH